MQQAGYIKIGDEKILVLVRHCRYGRQFKIRKSGKDGIFMEDESLYLKERPDLIRKLKAGNIIEC